MFQESESKFTPSYQENDEPQVEEKNEGSLEKKDIIIPFFKEPIVLYQSIAVWGDTIDSRTLPSFVEDRMIKRGAEGSFLMDKPQKITPYYSFPDTRHPVYIQTILDNKVIESLSLKDIFPNRDEFSKRGLDYIKEVMKEKGITDENIREDVDYNHFSIFSQLTLMSYLEKVLEQPDQQKKAEMIERARGWYNREWGIKPYTINQETKQIIPMRIAPEYIRAFIYEAGPFIQDVYQEEIGNRNIEIKNENEYLQLAPEYLPKVLEQLKQRIRVTEAKRKGKEVFFGVSIPYFNGIEDVLLEAGINEEFIAVYKETGMLPMTGEEHIKIKNEKIQQSPTAILIEEWLNDENQPEDKKTVRFDIGVQELNKIAKYSLWRAIREGLSVKMIRDVTQEADEVNIQGAYFAWGVIAFFLRRYIAEKVREGGGLDNDKLSLLDKIAETAKIYNNKYHFGQLDVPSKELTKKLFTESERQVIKKVQEEIRNEVWEILYQEAKQRREETEEAKQKGGRPIRVPEGVQHHWRNAISFINIV